jgi:predicted metal-dependent hydrolase
MYDAVPEYLEVTLAGEAVRVPVIFERSDKSSRLRLSLRPGPKARVVVPHHVSAGEAIRFAEDHRDWLARALKKLGPAGEDSVAAHLQKFPWVSVSGKFCNLESDTITGRPFLVHKEGEELVLFRHRDGDNVEPDLRHLLRKLASETLPGRTAWLAQKTGLRIGRVSVRNQRGRWGSCSADGAISLNWRLVLLPPALHDHVILHELAHRVHLDHSEKFWGQLAAWDPDWRTNDKTLTRDWGRLMDLARDEEE